MGRAAGLRLSLQCNAKALQHHSPERNARESAQIERRGQSPLRDAEAAAQHGREGRPRQRVASRSRKEEAVGPPTVGPKEMGPEQRDGAKRQALLPRDRMPERQVGGARPGLGRAEADVDDLAVRDARVEAEVLEPQRVVRRRRRRRSGVAGARARVEEEVVGRPPTKNIFLLLPIIMIDRPAGPGAGARCAFPPISALLSLLFRVVNEYDFIFRW